MRPIVQFSRILVGILFIFSGLIKANDPLGLAYKMQEFFEVWGRSGGLSSLMHRLDEYALAFSITVITFEIVAGVALLVGWKSKFFSWLIFLLMLFFLFLTGYALFSGKIKTCGCFGDCLPLTAKMSFIKDIILLLLIIVILFGTKYIRPVFKGIGNIVAIVVSTFLVLLLQWYVLTHLPILDCLPFKKGNNILELRMRNKLQWKVTFTPGIKVQNMLNGLKDKENNEPAGIYNVPCNSCNETYIGESKRIAQRLEDHKGNVRRYEYNKSAIARHVIRNKGHKINWENSKLIVRENHTNLRKINEGLAFQQHKGPLMNIDKGLILSNAWKPIIPTLTDITHSPKQIEQIT